MIGAAFAIAIASAPASAAPVVINPDFITSSDPATVAANNRFFAGAPFMVDNWQPIGFASHTSYDGAQWDNGSAGGKSVVGFLQGQSASLQQVVSGFVVGFSYRVSVSVNGRSAFSAPTLTITANGTQIRTPALVSPVDPLGTFRTAFLPIQSDLFVATNTSMTIAFATTAGSDSNGTALLTGASVTQIPEPISLAVLGIGLAGIGVARRRRGTKAR